MTPDPLSRALGRGALTLALVGAGLLLAGAAFMHFWPDEGSRDVRGLAQSILFMVALGGFAVLQIAAWALACYTIAVPRHREGGGSYAVWALVTGPAAVAIIILAIMGAFGF